MAKEITQKYWKWIAGTVLGVGIMWFFAARFVDAWSRRPTEERLSLGRQIFEHEWQRDDPLAGEGDGLGPVFNEKSCVACHFQGGVGGGGTNRFNVLAYEAMPAGDRTSPSGGVVHAFAIDEKFQESRDIISRRYPIQPGGTKVVNGCEQRTPSFNPLDFEEINTPPLFGLGLIDDISELSIGMNGAGRRLGKMSKELEGDFGQGTVGRARVLPDGRLGRFGWKGQFASVEEFVATACAVELGLSNPMRTQDVPQQNVPDSQAKLDIDRRQLRALVCFVENLPRPVEILPSDAEQRALAVHGKEVFAAVGCADCHTPDLGGVDGVYSDFRLYDVDESKDPAYRELPDDLVLAASHPLPSEWKTPPLWGVADSAPYFHDGQSRTLRDAIYRHGHDALASRKKFEKLGDDEQNAVIAFLETLRAPPGLAPAGSHDDVDH